jgi:hypothetical protein
MRRHRPIHAPDRSNDMRILPSRFLVPAALVAPAAFAQRASGD